MPRGSASRGPKSRDRKGAGGQRPLRVGEEVRHALAYLFERGVAHDPALRDVPITVTEVRMSPDLRTATAFVLPLGGRSAAEVVAALNHAGAYLGGAVGRHLGLRFSPRMRFVADPSFDEADRIGRALREAARRDAALHPAPGAAAEGSPDDPSDDPAGPSPSDDTAGRRGDPSDA